LRALGLEEPAHECVLLLVAAGLAVWVPTDRRAWLYDEGAAVSFLLSSFCLYGESL
jgi:hypothetical protein